MSLWNIIRDFFVQYAFGGSTSTGNCISNMHLGDFFNVFTNGEIVGGSYDTNLVYFILNVQTDGSMGEPVDYVLIGIGDWLSTTATIITLVGLFIAITLLIISLFKWIVRLVSLRG